MIGIVFMKPNSKEPSRLSISAIICTKNRSHDLLKCFDSIIKQTIPPDDIIVIDSSTNLDTKRLCSHYKNVLPIPLIYQHSEPGLTKQRNIGVKHCQNDIASFLDDDVILENDYFLEIRRAFSSSDTILGVGGCITNVPSDSLLSKVFKRLFLYTEFSPEEGIMKRSGFARFPCGNRSDAVLSTQVLVGCSSSYRNCLFKIHTFDEFFNGYSVMEDIEFSHRISKQGLLVYWPEAKLFHKKSPADRQSIPQRYEMLINNHFYVFNKNVKNSPLDWLFFSWSRIGIVLLSFYESLRERTSSPFICVFSLHLKLLCNVLKDRYKQA